MTTSKTQKPKSSSVALGLIIMFVAIIGSVIENAVFGNNFFPGSWREFFLDCGLLALMFSGVIFATSKQMSKPLICIGLLYLIPALLHLI